MIAEARNPPVVRHVEQRRTVISRSAEVKALGVKMGAPMHHIRDVVRQHRIATLSTNYGLYGDISQRMTAVIGQFAPVQEIHSIDESFLDLTDLPGRDLVAHAQAIRQRVKKVGRHPDLRGHRRDEDARQAGQPRRPETAGVQEVHRLDLFADAPKLASAGTTARERLMLTLDKVNCKEGRGTMRFASKSVDHRRRMRRENVSPAYTTRWEEVPAARA